MARTAVLPALVAGAHHAAHLTAASLPSHRLEVQNLRGQVIATLLLRPCPQPAACPPALQVALVEQLLEEVAAGPLALVLSPSWSTGVPEQYQPLVDSFTVAYSFLPVALQVCEGGGGGEGGLRQPACWCADGLLTPARSRTLPRPVSRCSDTGNMIEASAGGWQRQGINLHCHLMLPQQRARCAGDTPCVMPLPQGLLGGKEGAVLRNMQQGGDDSWRILWRSGQQHVQVGRTKRRPTSDDLQLAFMNAAAADSPLTKTVKFFKGLTAKKQ